VKYNIIQRIFTTRSWFSIVQ